MKDSLKIAFHTLGCKLNFSETSAITRDFAINDHYEFVNIQDVADVYVINSCSVTHNAEKKCRELIRRLRRQNPNALIAIIGCYSQLKSGEIDSAGQVDLILGNHEKFQLFDYVEQFRIKQPIQKLLEPSKLNKFIPAWSGEGRTRKFLKIQDGCDYGCSYCIVPMARGRSRSDNIEATMNNVKTLAEKGVKELVLTGVNIGDFGKMHKETFFGLLKELDKIKGIERIRLSSVEPDLLEDDIIKLVADSQRIMPHFHIPLQSGSDKVLAEMKRKYDTVLLSYKVEKIKKHMPLACIAIDIIAGFPLETDEDFSDTVKFIDSLPVSYLHVFTFSRRENTPAAGYKDVFEPKDRNLRSKLLKELSRNKLKTFYAMNKGRETNVLFEGKTSNGFISGFTPNYIRVKTPFDSNLESNIKKVQLIDFDVDMQFECKII